MADQDPTPEEIIQQLNDTLQLLGEAETPALDGFTALQEKRAKRLQNVGTRISKKLGEDHPRVVTLRQAQARTTRLQNNLKTSKMRLAKLRMPKPNEWVLNGQVLNRLGKPASGVNVRLCDKNRKYADVLGFATTDKEGDFQLSYVDKTLLELTQAGVELFLFVENPDGKVLYTTDTPQRFQAGGIDNYTIKL